MQRVRSRIGDELKRKEKNRKGGGGGSRKVAPRSWEGGRGMRDQDTGVLP